MHKTEIKDISQFSMEKAKGMSCYICEKCYRISKDKLVSCPKCGATSSYVLPDELATLITPLAKPVGAGTGGAMPKSWEGSSPSSSILPVETDKEPEKKRSKKKIVR